MSGHAKNVLSFPNRTQAPPSEDHIDEIWDALRCLTAAMMRAQRQVQMIHRILEQMECRDMGGADPPRLTPVRNCGVSVEGTRPPND